MRIAAISRNNLGEEDSLSIPWLLLHCLGFGSCSAWVHVAFFSTTIFSGEVGPMAWLGNIVSNGIAMVVLGLLARRAPSYNGSKRFLPVAVACVLAATLVSAFLRPFLPLVAYLLLGPVLAGVGTASLLLLWAEAYTQIDPFTAKRYSIPGAMATGVFAYLLIVELPQVMGILVTALLPVLSGVCLRSTCDLRYTDFQVPGRGAGAEGGQMGRLVRFVLAVSVYCLAAGFMSGRSTSFTDVQASGAGAVMFAGIAVLLIAAAVVCIAFVKPNGDDVPFRMVVPLMAAGLLLMPFLSAGIPVAVSNVAIMGGYIVFEIYVWSQLQIMAAWSSMPPAMVFGIGKSGMNLGLLVGCLLGMFAAGRSTMAALSIATLIVYVFILLGAKGPSSLRQQADGLGDVAGPAAADGPSAAPSRSREDVYALACREVAEEYGLSSRERDVFGMICRGRNLESVAESLGVAQSTVRTHRDHIYQKLGVHNRQEMLDRLEERVPGD